MGRIWNIWAIVGLLTTVAVTPGKGCTFGSGCPYECHCEGGLLCNQNTGDCANGCDNGVILPGPYGYRGTWSGYGCQIGNQAYMKTAIQGPTTWPDIYQNQADRAVDGNINPKLEDGSCSHPLAVDNTNGPWWQVDLGAQFVIVSVNITNRQDQTHRLTYVTIEVSQDGTQYQDCATLPDIGRPSFVDRDCDTSLLGRYVRLRRLRSAPNGDAMNFCEVQVYAYRYNVCPLGSFGIACHTPCNCQQPCDDVTGRCSAGCIPGKMGYNCQEDCAPRRWGSNCIHSCTCSNQSEACDPTNGFCMSDCRQGLAGPSCDVERPSLFSTVYLQELSSTTITASFAPWAPDNGGGDPPTNYRVQYSRDSNGPWNDGVLVTHTDGVNPYTVAISSLLANNEYYVRVIPIIQITNYVPIVGNPTQVAGPILVVAPTTPATVTPRLYSTVYLEQSSSNSISISFAAWTSTNGAGDPPTHYNVQYSQDMNGPWENGSLVSHTDGMATYTRTLSSLSTGVTYYVRVVPIIITDSGSWITGYPTQVAGLILTVAPTTHTIVITAREPEQPGPTTPNTIATPGDESRVATTAATGGLPSGAAAGIAIFVILILVIVAIGLLLWRRADLRQKVRNRLPANLLIAKGRGKKDPEIGGYENHALSPSPVLAPKPKVTLSPPSPALVKKSPDLRRLLPKNKADDTASVSSIPRGVPGPPSVRSEDPQSQDPIRGSTEDLSDDPDVPEGPVYKNVAVVGRPVRVDELETYMEDMESRSSGYQNEFVQIPTGITALCTVGLAPGNKSKNRYNNVCAYDHSRVPLTIDGGEKNETDYINATYIKAYKDIENGNIASQGPKATTVVDMWRLIWETKANRVIMITKLVENGRENCVQYWPTRGSKEYGKFKVTLASMEKFAGYVIRILKVEYNGETRTVCHFQFTSWPDKGVPEMATSLLDFRRKIRALDDQREGPQLVHCSAGIGRTGTFLAIDYLLQQAKKDGIIDVYHYTSVMRKSRVNMIQTLEQYIFVYRTLLESLQCGDPSLSYPDFEAAHPGLTIVSPDSGKSQLQEQFELLDRVRPKFKDVKFTGREKENIDKNRTKELVPSNRVRPFLSLRIDGTTDYINAAYVTGYRDRQAYMVTQQPLPDTVCDLWRLIQDHKVNTVVLLHPIDEEDETTPIYWPKTTDEKLEFGPLTIKLVKEEEVANGACVMREFLVTNSKKEKNKDQSVRQFELRGWPETAEVPPDTKELLATVDQVLRWQKANGMRPVIAQCRFGAHHSGLYVAASHMLERMRIDRQVDVFHAVMQVRAGRSELIPSLEQYSFLHDVARDYIRHYETYANLQ